MVPHIHHPLPICHHQFPPEVFALVPSRQGNGINVNGLGKANGDPPWCLLGPGAELDLHHPQALMVTLGPGLQVMRDRLPQTHLGWPTLALVPHEHHAGLAMAGLSPAPLPALHHTPLSRCPNVASVGPSDQLPLQDTHGPSSSWHCTMCTPSERMWGSVGEGQFGDPKLCKAG